MTLKQLKTKLHLGKHSADPSEHLDDESIEKLEKEIDQYVSAMEQERDYQRDEK